MKEETATRVRVRLTFPSEKVKRPYIHEIGKAFQVIYNIRRANVTAESGWVELELTGQPEEIERAVEALETRGVRVDPIEGDVVSP